MKFKHMITLLITTIMSSVLITSNVSAVVNIGDTQSVTEDTENFYEKWKSKYLVQDTYVTNENQYYVWYSEEKYNGNNVSVPVTVSEAHGYGMLILASMSNYDTNSKEYFDGMYRFYKAHPSDIGSNLMSWQQCDNGMALIDGAEDGSMTSGYCDSAIDGDMDIAYALLMADTIWGSNDDIDYYNEAIAIINDIMKYEVNHEYWTLSLGDWVSECDSSEIYYSATRSSDFIMQYLPVFADVTGDDNWLKVYDNTYEIINSFVDEYNTGLLPDFIIRDSSGNYVPAPADFLESAEDGAYSYNSCRTPWRIGMDYIINNNENALNFANVINSFIIQDTNSDPWEIMSGYTLDGTPIEDYNDLCFVAPFLITSACGDNSTWHENLRDTIINYGDDVYYGDTIKMLCLIVDDGNWIVPNSSTPSVPTLLGDVNEDENVDILDVCELKKHLINGTTVSKNADINQDGIIDLTDLKLLKIQLCN